MRQMDEYRVLEPKLPPLSAQIRIPRPLEVNLRDLQSEELDVFQLALTDPTVLSLLDQCGKTDLEAAQKLLSLFERSYITVSD
jgi:hypothetical protein